jgi:hypothetical protein
MSSTSRLPLTSDLPYDAVLSSSDQRRFPTPLPVRATGYLQFGGTLTPASSAGGQLDHAAHGGLGLGLSAALPLNTPERVQSGERAVILSFALRVLIPWPRWCMSSLTCAPSLGGSLEASSDSCAGRGRSCFRASRRPEDRSVNRYGFRTVDEHEKPPTSRPAVNHRTRTQAPLPWHRRGSRDVAGQLRRRQGVGADRQSEAASA